MSALRGKICRRQTKFFRQKRKAGCRERIGGLRRSLLRTAFREKKAAERAFLLR